MIGLLKDTVNYEIWDIHTPGFTSGDTRSIFAELPSPSSDAAWENITSSRIVPQAPAVTNHELNYTQEGHSSVSPRSRTRSWLSQLESRITSLVSFRWA